MFDILGNLYTKKEEYDLTSYAPFMANRFLSFYSKDLALKVNVGLNKTYYPDKRVHYIIAQGITPKLSKAPYVKYVKKAKEAKKTKSQEEEELNIKKIAAQMEISVREATQMMQFLDDLKKE